jgi:HEAT repeat protein
MRSVKLVVTALVTAGILSASPAHAGRGSSPGAIQSAIASNSVDAIASELERSEHLVCGVCVRMVRPLLDHADRRVRTVAAWWLSRRGLGGELLGTMTARLSDPDPIKARNAADVLASIKLQGAIAPLGEALADGTRDPQTRAAAARALGAIGSIDGLSHLGKGLAADNPAVRAAAVSSLRELRGFEDPSLAVPLLGDADEDVRIEAIYTIGATRGKAMVAASGGAAAQTLASLVTTDPSPRVRKKAAWALGEIGAPVGVAGPALSRAAQQDADPLVRSLAAAALGRLAK